MEWQIVDSAKQSGLRLTFRDHGPGISDLNLAMTDGWTSAGGPGLGVTGPKRLVDNFEINTAPGAGTCVMICKWV
ncbi:anti-sigma-regulatory factor [Pseudomonas fluorescens]|uniref:Anti-sigma-regulatory factor n=1 Tax=Pseudomonas fluorescens TaxID=294 RepID=A0A448DVQ7_PSEFL|nr:anti-sigma-regulatory factor [Pseudomonas fluorescens]